MNSILRHPAPHVEPGTNFNIHRFHELYRWIAASSADAVRAAVQPNGYGLMLPEDGKSGLELQVAGNTLLLSRCCAITPGGWLIGIFEEKWGSDAALQLELNIPEAADSKIYFDMAVVVLPESRQPVGVADPDEVPCRQPFSLPAYRLEVSPAGQKDFTKIPNALKIGELESAAGHFRLREHIPACIHLGAHPVLWKKYLEYQAGLGQLQDCLAAIARQTTEAVPEMKNLRELAFCLGKFLAEKQSSLWSLGMKGSPGSLMEICISFASLFRFCLNSLSREMELMELIRHNVDSAVGMRFQPQTLRDAVEGLAVIRYMHRDIQHAIRQTDIFFQVVSPVFQILKNRVAPINGVRTW